MRRSAGRLALYVGMLLALCIPPGVVRAQGTGTPQASADTSAARARDSIAQRRAVDSAARRAQDVAMRRAIDSAARRMADSLYADYAEDRRVWSRVTWGLLVIGAIFLALLVADMWRGHDVLVESHWGGFGGGVGGTRLSRTLVLAVMLLLTGGMLTAVALSRSGRLKSPDEKREKPADSTTTTRTTTSTTQGSGSVVAPGSAMPNTSPAGR